VSELSDIIEIATGTEFTLTSNKVGKVYGFGKNTVKNSYF
jgi:hypothetical protein